jgi:erythromycin esterase-like protein
MSTKRRRALGLFLAGVIAATVHTSSPLAAVENEESAFLDWVAETAVPIEIGPGGEVAGTDWSALDNALAGKRIVYLGASDHWVQQKYSYREALIRHLLVAGWHHVGMEMDFADGMRIDRYLESGDTSQLDRVALYGYEGGRREDRDDLPNGFPGMRNREFRKAFHTDELRFLAALRELNTGIRDDGERLHWFGYDVGVLPGVGLEEARDLLAGSAHSQLSSEIMRRLTNVPDETRLEEAVRLEELSAFLSGARATAVEAMLGPQRSRLLKRLVQHEAAALRFREAAHEGPRSMSWMMGLQVREKVMLNLVDAIFAELPPDAKIILMGHNLHLNKASERIHLGPSGSPAPPLWTTVGTHLERTFPGQVLAIWMTYDHGRHGTVLTESGVGQVASTPGTVESLLARVGPAFYLPLDSADPRASYVSAERNFLQNGSVASACLSEQIDMLVFFSEATALGGR